MNPLSIDPVHPPRLHGVPVGSSDFKLLPEDFLVDELLGFSPSGEGEHCLLWVEKIGRNSNAVAADLASLAGIRRRLVTHCGLKDQQAITRQWFSLHLPGTDSPPLDSLVGDGFRALQSTRHRRKLKRGAHRGNRFQIRLRNVVGDRNELESRWQTICQLGVPNYFGVQRFGNTGQNLDQARQLFDGSVPVSDRLLRGILLSAARSAIFNVSVGQRVLDGSWSQMMPGDVLGFPDNHSLILPDNRRGDESQRFADGVLHSTGPLWGEGAPASLGVVCEREQQAADQLPDLAAGLVDYRLRQERRVTRLVPQNSSCVWDDPRTLTVRFDLPSGCYATSVLREWLDCRQDG